MAEQFVDDAATMIARNGLVHLSPELLDFVDPRMPGGLEDHRELRVRLQPFQRLAALVDDVVVGDEHDTAGAAIGAAQGLERRDEQVGILPRMEGPHDLAGLGMQGPGDIVLAIDPGRRHGKLFALGLPGVANAG